MPPVMNGCRTWCHGKRNRPQHPGICRTSGNMAVLKCLGGLGSNRGVAE